MADSLKQGDKVEWRTPNGPTYGQVVKKMTSDGTYEGLDIKASKDEPRFVVKSDKSGKFAAHKADSLKRKG